MPHPYVDSIQHLLWPEETGRDIWMVADGARDIRVYSHLLDSYLESSCLYSGALPRELEYVAPYVVSLEYNDRTTRRILAEGWGDNWGVFLKCPTTINKLRRHLREFLLVLDPGNKRMVFRYYDPRVLRIYLPTCTVTELSTFFGPIQVFWTEGRDPSTLLEFAFDGRKLVQKTIHLEASAAPLPK
jgi:hypothetical protein